MIFCSVIKVVCKNLELQGHEDHNIVIALATCDGKLVLRHEPEDVDD